MKAYNRLQTKPVTPVANKPYTAAVAAVTEVQLGEFNVAEYDKIVGSVRSDKDVTLNIYSGKTQTGVDGSTPTFTYLKKETAAIAGATVAEGSATKITAIDISGPVVKISVTGHATDAAVVDVALYAKRV